MNTAKLRRAINSSATVFRTEYYYFVLDIVQPLKIAEQTHNYALVGFRWLTEITLARTVMCIASARRVST